MSEPAKEASNPTRFLVAGHWRLGFWIAAIFALALIAVPMDRREMRTNKEKKK
jgi:hypothetical protein